jgi:hypothetical protein
MVFAPIYVRVIIGQNWLSGLLDYTIAQLHSWKYLIKLWTEEFWLKKATKFPDSFCPKSVLATYEPQVHLQVR